MEQLEVLKPAEKKKTKRIQTRKSQKVKPTNPELYGIPLFFCSRKIIITRRNYTTTEQEVLSIAETLKE